MTSMFNKILDVFIATGNMWAVIFVFLLIFTLITNTRREEERRQELREFRENIEKNMNQILMNSNLILETWKVLIQRELKRRK